MKRILLTLPLLLLAAMAFSQSAKSDLRRQVEFIMRDSFKIDSTVINSAAADTLISKPLVRDEQTPPLLPLIMANDAIIDLPRLDGYNPADVLEIQVIKQGASVLYGSRAALGVIIVKIKTHPIPVNKLIMDGRH